MTIALLLVHPTGERDEHGPQRRRRREHCAQATRGVGFDRLAARSTSKSTPFGASIGSLDAVDVSDRRPTSRSSQ
jgi:hypothetical protein